MEFTKDNLLETILSQNNDAGKHVKILTVYHDWHSRSGVVVRMYKFRATRKKTDREKLDCKLTKILENQDVIRVIVYIDF